MNKTYRKFGLRKFLTTSALLVFVLNFSFFVGMEHVFAIVNGEHVIGTDIVNVLDNLTDEEKAKFKCSQSSMGGVCYVLPEVIPGIKKSIAALSANETLYVTSTYRECTTQVQLWNAYKAGTGSLAAQPGTSNHGYGIAIDVCLDVGGTLQSICDHKSGFSSLASLDSKPTEKAEAERLKAVMGAGDFKGINAEYWHFEYTLAQVDKEPGCKDVLAASGGTTTPTSADVINLQVPIPIGEEGTYIEGGQQTFFFSYIVKIYRWIAGIAGAIAVLMVMAGGFQIALARGESGMVEDGKKRIQQAIMGLGLLFMSSILLRTINPQFYQIGGAGGPGTASVGAVGYTYRELNFQDLLVGEYGSIITSAAETNNIPKEILAALLYQESAGKLDAVSESCALGIAQMIPATAKHYGLNVPDQDGDACQCKLSNKDACDPNDERLKPEKEIPAAAAYLKDLLSQVSQYSSLEPKSPYIKMIGSYNAGIAANVEAKDCDGVTKWSCTVNPGGYTQTQSYVKNIITNLCAHSDLEMWTKNPELKTVFCESSWNGGAQISSNTSSSTVGDGYIKNGTQRTFRARGSGLDGLHTTAYSGFIDGVEAEIKAPDSLLKITDFKTRIYVEGSDYVFEYSVKLTPAESVSQAHTFVDMRGTVFTGQNAKSQVDSINGPKISQWKQDVATNYPTLTTTYETAVSDENTSKGRIYHEAVLVEGTYS